LRFFFVFVGFFGAASERAKGGGGRGLLGAARSPSPPLLPPPRPRPAPRYPLLTTPKPTPPSKKPPLPTESYYQIQPAQAQAAADYRRLAATRVFARRAAAAAATAPAAAAAAAIPNGAAYFVAQERRFGDLDGSSPDVFSTFTVAALAGTTALDVLGEAAAATPLPTPHLPLLTAALVARGFEQTDRGTGEDDDTGYLRQPPPMEWQVDQLDAQREAAGGGRGGVSGGWWWPPPPLRAEDAAAAADDDAAAVTATPSSSCQSGPCPALLDSGELDVVYSAAFGGSRDTDDDNGATAASAADAGSDGDDDDGARLWLAGKAVLPGAAYADGRARAAVYYAAVARPEELIRAAAADDDDQQAAAAAAAAPPAGARAPSSSSSSPPPSPTARGVLAQGGRAPLGLAYPAVAVSPSGTALFTFAYSEGESGYGGGGYGGGGYGGGGYGGAPAAALLPLLPDGTRPYAGVAVAAVAGPNAKEAYVPAKPSAVAVVRRGAGPVASEPVPGLKGPRGEPVLRMGGVSAAMAVGGGGGGGGGRAGFATATSYSATPPRWSPSTASPSNLGVWAAMIEVEE
jgi:hypothetical protein